MREGREDAGKTYLAKMDYRLDKRYTEDLNEEWNAFTKTEPVLSNILSVAMTFVKPLELFTAWGVELLGGEVNEYSPVFTVSNAQDAIRDKSVEMIREGLEGTGLEELAVSAYEMGMPLLDVIAVTAVTAESAARRRGSGKQCQR